MTDCFGIEVTATTISGTSHNGTERKTYVFHEKHAGSNEEELALAKLYQIIYKLSIQGGEDTASIGARLCFHLMHTNFACEIYECIKEEVLRSKNKFILWNESLCDNKSSLAVWYRFKAVKMQRH